MEHARQARPDAARHRSVSRPFWPASPFAPRSKARIERVLGVQRAEKVFCGGEDAVQLLRQVLWYCATAALCNCCAVQLLRQVLWYQRVIACPTCVCRG